MGGFYLLVVCRVRDDGPGTSTASSARLCNGRVAHTCCWSKHEPRWPGWCDGKVPRRDDEFVGTSFRNLLTARRRCTVILN